MISVAKMRPILLLPIIKKMLFSCSRNAVTVHMKLQLMLVVIQDSTIENFDLSR